MNLISPTGLYKMHVYNQIEVPCIDLLEMKGLCALSGCYYRNLMILSYFLETFLLYHCNKLNFIKRKIQQTFILELTYYNTTKIWTTSKIHERWLGRKTSCSQFCI